jgi:uncharacterized protein
MEDTPVLDQQAKTFGMLCHLLALSIFVLPGIGHILGPLVIWLIKKDQIPFVDDQGKESLNFQISLTIYTIASLPLWLLFLVGIPLTSAVFVFGFVMVIVAALKANEGVYYRYPLCIRFIK